MTIDGVCLGAGSRTPGAARWEGTIGDQRSRRQTSAAMCIQKPTVPWADAVAGSAAWDLDGESNCASDQKYKYVSQ